MPMSISVGRGENAARGRTCVAQVRVLENVNATVGRKFGHSGARWLLALAGSMISRCLAVSLSRPAFQATLMGTDLIPSFGRVRPAILHLRCCGRLH